MDSFTSLDTPDEVAVIGMAGRFPKARTVAEFWKNLRDGVEAISFYSDEELIAAGIDRAALSNPKYVKAGALLEDLDMFDAAFFGFTPREAQLMDPQHRVFLECAWEALENAGYVSETFPGRIGVYAGVGLNNYWFNLYSNLQVLEAMGSYRTIISNDKDYLSTWVSYKMNLKGPSVSVQTACSTSLVAIHMGAQSLLGGECDIALAGGVSMGLLQKAGYYYQEGAISSPDGHCRAFDARAQGTITGSGVGIVVLKRLEDALADGDYINAVIKASAINNDGAVKVGFTAPSVEGQSKVIAEALAIASVDPATISYIEAHGTATPLGDPIEIEALTRAFRARTQMRGFCAIGSVKTNIGHLDAAAGVAGFIKTVLALKHRLIPPSLHFERPNPQVDFASSPFYVNSKLSEWKNGDFPRRAGVSSFGIGGTNAHIILEEAQKVEPSGPSRPYHLLVLSARTASALETTGANLALHLEENPGLNLADVAYTLQTGRKAFSHRSAIVARDTGEALKALKTRDSKRLLTSVCEADDPPVAFMFAGQGTQYVGMALGLYESEPAFRSRVDKCCEMLTPQLGLDLRSVIYPGESEARQSAELLRQTFVTQTALFVIEYALAKLWMDWGVRPQAMIGHSLGEYVAACLAEVFPLEVALELVAARARLMQDLPTGAMLAVPLTEEDARQYLDEQISLAAINGQARCVFSGATASIERLEHKLSESGLVCRRLQTSHAFHSPMMDPALEPFIERVSAVSLQAPKIPFLSNVTGTWITAEEATDPRYWARHLRQPVRFNDGLDELLKEPDRILLEVAPGQTLAMLARQHPVAAQVVLSSLRSAHERATDAEFLLTTLGKLWLAGVAVRWPNFYAGQRRLRLPLPAYPFERKRYWIEAQTVKAQKVIDGNGAQAKPEDSIPLSIQQDAITVNAVGKEAPMNVEEKLMPVAESRVGVVRAPALESRIMSVLMTIVKDLTGIEAHEVDIQASFFDMGIDSLLLIQANQMVEDRLGVKISVVTLLEELETIQALADYVAEQLPAEDTVIDLLPHESGSYMPAQQIEQESLAQSPAAVMSAERVEAEDTQEKRVSVGLPDNGNGSRQPDLQPVRPEPARLAAETQTPAAATDLSRHESQIERAQPPQPVAAISPALMHTEPGGNIGNGKSATGTALEWIVSQQLQIMSQQLNALRDSQGDAPVVAQPVVHSQPVQSQTAAVATPPRSVAAELPTPPVAAPPAVADIPLPSVKEGPDKIVPEPFLPYRPIKLEAARGISPALKQNMEDFINRYVARTQKSKRLTDQYRGVLADSRNSATFRLSWKELVYPIVGERSKGSRLWDVDGNEYVDIANGFGVNLFGHSPSFISEAINSQLERGFDFGLQPHISFEAAQLVSELTGAERVNFCNSGTEAVMGALRIARTVTKRSKIALFSGSYHGWSDGTLARPITVDSEQRSVPAAPGVSPRAVEDVLVLDYDSPKSLEILKAHMDELAAVLVEPVQSRRPDLQPREFLHEVRRLTEDAETVLIFDEMVTGFRIHPGGAQAWFGVKADLATYGKVVGGGMPIGVIAGKAACMDAFDGGLWNYGDTSHPRADKTMFAGAFFKHPLTMAAAVAVLRHLKASGPALQNRLNERTAYLANDLNAFFKQRDLPIRVVHYGSLFRFMYPRELKYMDFLFYHLVERGVFASLEVGNCFLSTAHTDEDIDYVIRTVKESIDAMQSGGFLPGGAPAGGNTGRSTSSSPQSPQTGPGSTGSSQSSASVMTAMADPSPTASTVILEPACRAMTVQGAQADTRVQFSLYYFGNYDSGFRDDKYDLLFEGARFADKNGFQAIWVPERHFHGFGGFSPNPSVIVAALARETSRLQLRAGSVVLPLHHPVRVAEEWAVVDNISKGRVGVSFASGWHPDDFVFAPHSYESRRELMFEGIETVKKLWRGETIPVQGGAGNTLHVKLFPMPMQAELPIWLTCHHPDTYTRAGEIGAGVLTNLTTQSVQDLARNIALYRESLARHGFDGQSGHVTVLLHTHILKDQESARQQARQPFYNYLKSSFGLLRNMVESQGLQIDFERLSEKDLDYILSTAYDRYVQSRAIIGTPESCAKTVDELTAIGVNEIGCFIDFGIDTGSVLEGFDYLHDLRVRYEKPALDTADQSSPPIIIQSHAVSGPAAAAVAQKVPPSPFDSGTQQTASAVEAAVSVPLTEVQKQVWTIAQMGDEVSRAYNDSLTFRLRGPFRLDAMRQAVQKLVDRHEALRTTFSPDGQYQLIHPSLKISLPLVDFSQVESDAREAQAAEWVAGEAQQAFDLARGPLIRVRVARLDELDHLFVLTTFHIIADGQSYENLLGDLSGLYSAACEGVEYKAPPPTQFRQYAEQKAESVSATADEQYWLELFSDGLPILELPTDRERPAAITFKGARHSLMIGGQLSNDLRKLSSKHRSTMFTTLLTAFKVLLHQLSGQHDIVVGINAAETVAANEQGLVGNRVSPLAIRAQIRGELSFAQCLRAVKRRVLEAYDHRSYTAHKLLRKLKVRRDAGGLFMVRAVFNLERDGELKFHGLDVETVTNPTGSSRTDIYLNITEKEKGLLLDCDYNADLFDRATIQRWMEHFETLLGEIASDSEKPLSSLSAPARPEAAAVEAASPQHESQSSNLTRYQQLVWVGQKLNPDAAVYITTGYIIIPARLDPNHFKRGIQAYVDHCEALRTVITEENGVPRQVVLESFPYEPDVLDFSSLADPRAEAYSYLHERCRIPLNMSERLFDFVMIELPGDQTVLFFNLHHIIGDSWSCALTSGFVLDFYKRSAEGRLDEPVLLHPFSDYVEFERAYLNSPRAVEEEAYWKQKLAQRYDPITFYGKAPIRQTTNAQRISVKIGQERTRRLKEIAGTKELMKLSLDSSLSNMFAAILCAYLYHISGSRHISLGLPVHNRRTREFKETIGLFMQILPLRITIEDDDTFISLIDKIARESIENLRYSRFPIGNPVQKQAYDVEMNYINQAFTFYEGAPVEVQWLHPDHGTESFALQIHDYSSSGDFDFNFDFHCDVFEPHQRDQAIKHFLNVVDAFLDDNRQLVRRLNLLSPEEEHKILAGFNQTEIAYPREKTLAQLFEEQVERTPDNLAVGFEGRSLSYAQLNARANRMAHHLRAAGVGPETLVALLARRGTDLLTAILAVFKAGAAYLPLDPFYPKKRISQVLAQSKSALIISAEEYLSDLTDALNQMPAAERPAIEVMEKLVSREGEEGNCASSREPSNLAYVIYTSGSTGIPKGAMVEQSGMINHLYAKIDDLALTERDKIAQTASQSFDISVWQFLAGLVVGGQVEIVGEEEAKDPGRLMELVEREGITVLETVPSMLRAMIEEAERRREGKPVRLEGLRWVLVTGEALPPELCREWLKIYPEIPLVNAYGPTECSDDITHYFITKPLAEEATNTPVGYPISNMRIYVLDREMEPVPVGVAGELFAGGIGVGRGYLRDAERTAAVFVPDPFGVDEGARLYRTGDLARWLPDGTIEFLGRVDDQVKVRGHRIELGEIEAELQRHPAIKQAVVAARGDAPGDKRLVAYVVSEDLTELSIKDLRNFLKEKLPEYMVPSAFVTMEAFPLTPNGKLDRQALPAPEQARPELEEGFVAPRSREEESLAEIWGQVLGIPQVGVFDNFFELGGDSILSIQVAARANQAGLRITPMQLFEYQTVAELASAAGTNRAIEAEQGMVTGDVTLTPIQRWFFEMNVFDPHHFNQAVLFEARKSLTPEILEKAVERLLEHHDALRLRFTREQSSWKQVNRGMDKTAAFALMDLSLLPESEQSPAIEAAAARTQASLDLSEGPLMRVVLFELGENRPARLLIVIHHLAVDGVSWRILLEDLQMAYDQISRGETVSLPLKTTSYKRWAERLAEYAQSTEILEESNYWLDDTRSQVEPLPRDFPDGINSIASGRDVSIWLGAEDTRTLLQEVPAIYQTQINDVLLMALARSFAGWTGSQLLLVDLEGHGREEIVGEVDLSRTVGWFTSIYPLLLDLRGIQSPLGALNAVRQQLRSVPNRGIGYGLLRYLNDMPEIADRLRALPQPEVSFNYLGQFDQVVSETTPFRGARESSGPAISLREGHLHSRIRLLEIDGFVAEGQLRLNWTYSENVYRRSTIETLAQRFAEELKTLITLCRSGQEDEDADSSPTAFEWGTSELNDITSALNKSQK